MMISKNDTADIEDKISAFEERFHISLPEQYRSFLLKYNGGITPETEFKYKRTAIDIRAFYGIGQSIDYYSFDNIFETILKDILPLAFLSIMAFFQSPKTHSAIISQSV